MDATPHSQKGVLRPSLPHRLASFLGPEHVGAASEEDAVAGMQPKLVIVPGSEGDLADALRIVTESGLSAIPRGGGTKMCWGNPPSRADVVFSTARLNEITEHAWADLTVSVGAGCTIETLQETLARHGQRLAIDPLWPAKATVGGVLSTNDSGALRLRFGALRDLVIGVTLALPNGTLASSGGKVVKNVAGYDLPKLATGAFGTLGVITRAVFRLHPLPRNARSFSICAKEVAEARQLIHAVQNSTLAHTALQARFENKAASFVDILFEGTEAGLDAQEAHLKGLAARATPTVASPEIWNARQDLWSFREPEWAAIAKISILPAEMDKSLTAIAKSAKLRHLRFEVVLEATGIGFLKLEGDPADLRLSFEDLREQFEGNAGSLVVLHRPAGMAPFDAWGSAGDALPLMKAVKKQLDPGNVLNPGRFVGGI
jgi:glycolate dehydrogenase FAD-binding subunit